MQNTTDLISRIKNCIRSIEPAAEIFLFGSRARNDSTEFSDWDFLVLVDGEVTAKRSDSVRHPLYEIEWDTGEVISVLVKSRKVWNSPGYRAVPLHKSVELEGIRI